ncbi:MAG: LLM class flavin-dependent oxidoreductase [Proteobacteria bacterium]|nr:MAG: LLM class flavin-dependent oxidoreductase [Pseudomonadota bacterium]
MSLSFGLFSPFRNPPKWRIPWVEFYESQLRHAEIAEELGYDEIWLSEHHFCEDGWSPSLFPIAAAMAQRTKRIRIGTFVLLLPLGKHPVQVAEDAATLDILSNGRFDLGVGLGYRVPEYKGFGISRSERAERMEEALEIIHSAFTKERFSFSGKHFDLENVEMMPRPIQDPHPPIWVAAMSKRAANRAARFGFNVACTGGENLQQYYDDALVSVGKNPEDFSVGQLRLFYVAPTRDQAWDETQHYAHYMMAAYDRWLKEAADVKWFQETMSVSSMPPPEKLRDTPDLTFFEAPLVIGTPDDAIAEIERYQKSSRVTHLVIWMQLAGMDPKKVEACMKLFAQEVMPHFR